MASPSAPPAAKGNKKRRRRTTVKLNYLVNSLLLSILVTLTSSAGTDADTLLSCANLFTVRVVVVVLLQLLVDVSTQFIKRWR